MNRPSRMRGWHAVLLGVATTALALAGPAAAATPAAANPAVSHAVKPAPQPPPDAWDPAAGPRVTPKPERAPGTEVQPLAAWSLTLSANPRRVWPRQWVTLTATASQTVGGTVYWISIFETGVQTPVAYCGDGTTCTVSVTKDTVADRSYYAYISRTPWTGLPLQDVQAVSNRNHPEQVSWHGTGIGLSASPTTVPVGGTTTLTATTGDDVLTSQFYIQIYDETTRTRLELCGNGQSCSVAVSQSAATTHRYAAYVSDPTTAFPPSGIISASAPSFVTWSNSGFQLSLTAPGRVYNSWQTTVTATVNPDISPTAYYIRVFNVGTGALVGTCGFGTTCSFTADLLPRWNTHVAFLSGSGDSTFPPVSAVASSNMAHTDVLWVG